MKSFKRFLLESQQSTGVPLVLDDSNLPPVSTNNSGVSNKGQWAKKFAKTSIQDLVGSLLGNYVVKPAAEKAEVFKPVEAGGSLHKVMSVLPSSVVNAAEKGLNAVNTGLAFALDPISSTGNFIASKIENSADQKLNQIRHTAPATKQEYEKAATEAAKRRKGRGIKTSEDLEIEQSVSSEPYKMRSG